MTNAAYITFILVGLLVTAFASGSPEVASSTGKGAKGVSTAAAGSSATSGSFAGGYGYAGSGVSNNALGADAAGGGVGLGEAVPVGGYAYMPFPQFPQFDFNLLLANYFQALNKYHQGLFSKYDHPKGSFASGVVFNSSPNRPVFFQASSVSPNGAVNQANANGAGAFSSTGYGFPGGFPAYQTFSSQNGYGAAGAAPSAGANTGSSYGSSGLSSSSPGGGFTSYASTNPGFGGFSGYGSSGFGGGSGFGGFGGFPNYAVPNFGGFDTINYGANAIPAGDNSAIASASIGQDGIQQSAAISPENSAVPNFNSRFADVPKEGGSFGVFTSSSSGSGNVNGKPVSFKQATTTVNNNGKITTHTVHDP